MQAEESVEVERPAGLAAARLRNGDGWPHAVVIRFAERNHHVQSVRGTALKQNHQLFFPGQRGGGDRTLEERGHGAQANQRDPGARQKVTPRKWHGTPALAAVCAHSAPLPNRSATRKRPAASAVYAEAGLAPGDGTVSAAAWPTILLARFICVGTPVRRAPDR